MFWRRKKELERELVSFRKMLEASHDYISQMRESHNKDLAEANERIQELTFSNKELTRLLANGEDFSGYVTYLYGKKLSEIIDMLEEKEG